MTLEEFEKLMPNTKAMEAEKLNMFWVLKSTLTFLNRGCPSDDKYRTSLTELVEGSLKRAAGATP